MMNFTAEQMKKAKACATLEEFQTLAKAEGFDFSDEEAETYFMATRAGELSDEDLDELAGSKGNKLVGAKTYDTTCPFCGHFMKISVAAFDDGTGFNTFEASENQCTCGARIEVTFGTAHFNFYKNGEKRRV